MRLVALNKQLPRYGIHAAEIIGNVHAGTATGCIINQICSSHKKSLINYILNCCNTCKCC